MTKKPTDQWYAYDCSKPFSTGYGVKLPADPRTLIRVYRAAMRYAFNDIFNKCGAKEQFLEACEYAEKKRVKQ